MLGVWGNSEAMVKQCDRQWSQLMSSFLWCPGERAFYGGPGREQVAQGCWVIHSACNFGFVSLTLLISPFQHNVCAEFIYGVLCDKKKKSQ